MAACPTCGNEELLNTEDILPTWLRKYAVRRPDRSGDFVGIVDGEAYQSPELFTRRVKIGKPCNTWMGSRFQSPARDVLVRLMEHKGQVHSTALLRVARWVAMTALVDALLAQRRPADSIYRTFRETGQPPDGSRVLIGSYTSPGLAPPVRLAFMGSSQPGAAESRQVSFLPLNQVLGQLVVAFAFSVEGPPVRTVAERKGLLCEIYPDTPDSLSWPREPGIGATGLQDAFTWEVVRPVPPVASVPPGD